jgi:hypothetical protein
MRKSFRSILVVGLVGSLPLFASVPARAAVCNVPSAMYPSLQSAEDDAACDPIVVAPGPFTPVAVDRDVTIQGQGPEITIINAGGGVGISSTGLSTDLTVRSLTVTGGVRGLYNEGTMTIENVVVRDNTGVIGGAGVFSASNSTLNVDSSVIRDNTSTSGDGAAINIQFDAALSIVDSTFVGNSASGNGGAIYHIPSVATGIVTNSTFSENHAGTNGGAILNFGTMALSNVTMTENEADQDQTSGGDGGGLYANGASATFQVRNSIVSGNFDSSTAGNVSPECDGAGGGTEVTSQGHNVFGALTNCAASTALSDRTGVAPDLAPTGDYGGPTPTRPPIVGSPAIDLVAAGACTDGATTITADQRGFPRPLDGDMTGIALCDAGAVERVPRDVELRAKNKVKRGKKVKLTAEVGPCFGHEGDVVRFMKKAKEIAAVPLDADCTVSTKTKVKKKTTFRAELEAGPEHPADVEKEKVKVKRPS